MRIGCLALRAPTGIGFEMETVMQHLEKEHEIFVLGFPHHEMGFPDGWDRLNMIRVNDPEKVSNKQIITWIKNNKLDLVLTKENTYNPRFFEIAKSMGVTTVSSVDLECFDYRNHRWKYCDLIICLTNHTVQFMKENGFFNIVYLPLWGIDLDYFRFIRRNPKFSVHFIHTAGTGGTMFRKGTPETVLAFDIPSRECDNIILTIYTQKPWDKYPQETQIVARYNKRINIIETRNKENIERFKENYSLYEKGDVAIQPSRWEGQGAAVIEALAMGLPVITTDAAPMNEFVQDNSGRLIKVKSFENVAYLPNKEYKIVIVDLESLIENILYFARNPEECEPRSINARQFMEENFSLDFSRARLLEEIEKIGSDEKLKVTNIVSKIKLIYRWYEEEKIIRISKKILLGILRYLRLIK